MAVFSLIGFLLAGMIVCLVFFDASALSYLRENQPTWNKNFCVQAFKQLGKVYVPVWLLLFWAWITGNHKTAIVCFLSLLITMAAVSPVKALVRRPRPKDVIKAETKIENETKLSRNWSFPSGDTASVFAVGTVLAFAVRRPFILGLAACCGGIGILRVVDLAHYPSDVFGGAALGVFCGWAAIRIKNRYPGIENVFNGRERMLSFIGVILIPILIWRLQGIDKLIILLEFYAPIALIIAVVAKRQPRQT